MLNYYRTTILVDRSRNVENMEQRSDVDEEGVKSKVSSCANPAPKCQRKDLMSKSPLIKPPAVSENEVPRVTHTGIQLSVFDEAVGVKR